MVYAICYCPLSRLADLEALKVAGEPWGRSREAVPGHVQGRVQAGGGEQELGEPAPPLLSQSSTQTQRPCRRASGTGSLRKWRRTETLWAGHWTCCLQTSSLPACLGGEGSRGRGGSHHGLEGMGGWNDVDWALSTTTGSNTT